MGVGGSILSTSVIASFKSQITITVGLLYLCDSTYEGEQRPLKKTRRPPKSEMERDFKPPAPLFR